MKRLTLVVFPLLLAACSSSHRPAPAAAKMTAPAPHRKAFIGEHGFDMALMDPAVKACDDFYRYATGNYAKLHPLPASQSRYGSFETVEDRNREILKQIAEEDAAMSNATPGSNEQKIGDFYASCMATDAVETAGLSPIQPELARIDAIHDLPSLQDEFARLEPGPGAVPFRVGAERDYKNSQSTIAAVGQSGLSLPDRDYYIRSDEKSVKTRDAYLAHVSRMFQLAGEDAARANDEAARVLMLETALANVSMTRIQMRDPNARYHMMTLGELQALAPHIDWSSYLRELGVPSGDRLNVQQPDYLRTVDQLLTSMPLDEWKSYLRWTVLDRNAATLSSRFVDESFAFRGAVLSGTTENLPRWQRCIRATDAELGQPLGQEYVRRAFTPEAKAHALELIGNLESTLRSDIPTLSWMSDATKQQALAKLSAFTRKIGYPDKWRDYSSLTISRTSYTGNVMRARRWAYDYGINRIGKPVDKLDWGRFTPPTVNASYNSSGNEITFPAGILQPPFYDPNADDAYNYGGIGVVIGHEMTHGFDDSGSQFDASGNLRNWWTEEDLKNFKARASCVSDEFSSFEVEPGLNQQGKLVLGEAIADLGGTTIAYAAYEKSLEGKPRETLDGFTPEQRFFLGFAQVWGQAIRPEEARRRTFTDPHPLGEFRINGTVANMPEFARAFHCSDGAKMVRPESQRCRIW
jgi:putative endopeptidase